MAKLILASASPRRREILALSGLPFVVRAGSGKEEIHETEPAEIVKELSSGKAEEALLTAEAGDIIIGADTVVAFEGRVMGKPKDEAEAFSMLKELQGRTHQVYTGITVIRKGSGERDTFAEKTTVRVLPMSDEEIWEYVETKEPMDKAGAYGIQGRFALYVEGIEGDYQNVVGLPLARLYGCLKKYREELT
ncbi:MAG: septum formation protein Maf [Lachnospiraceae bacterium]|jgi:septum formation protein|nr:septum formation protein Maf [Lachnospiraceae bacterium]